MRRKRKASVGSFSLWLAEEKPGQLKMIAQGVRMVPEMACGVVKNNEER